MRVRLPAFSLQDMHTTSFPTRRATLLALTLVTLNATSVAAQDASPGARPLVDLDARIRVESRSIGADGITRSSSYEETFMRRGQEVWTQRVIPRQAPVHEDDKTGHKHLVPHESGRLIGQHDGKPLMQLINAHNKVVVSIPAVEFANMGFDGSWERAYYLITARELQALPPSSRKSEHPDASWFEKKGAKITESVLWDNKRMVPRVIESSNRQGSQWRRVTVTPHDELARNIPWSAQATQAYEKLRHSDFLD